MPLRFDNPPTLIAYLTCGDPDIETSYRTVLASIDAGADIVELGVPFSDPVADGPVIQRAMDRACSGKVSLTAVLGIAARVRRERPAAGLIGFTYLNPVLRYGM